MKFCDLWKKMKEKIESVCREDLNHPLRTGDLWKVGIISKTISMINTGKGEKMVIP